ncbi:MAG: TIGR04283 family arsenosugar biosynthesis glycosyltransferase [Gemmatimonadota bacterium]|nr:TIGR04283 family arsenosugar biosynthesis glycosyltransferase [Gemmatimonadota bacterium]
MPPEREGPWISIVIPALDEERTIAGLLDDLRRLRVPRETIVVDGGSADATAAVARAAGARVLSAPRGRGSQLRAGAAAAAAPVLCFLHADVRLAPEGARRLDALAREPSGAAWAFPLRIDAPGPAYRLIELGANLRSRLLRLPYGDQGLVIRRDDYERAGGHPAIPVMEDVALARALRGTVPLRLLPEGPGELRVSARRWERDGPLRRTLRNWTLLVRYAAGVAPERLARRYVPTGEENA